MTTTTERLSNALIRQRLEGMSHTQRSRAREECLRIARDSSFSMEDHLLSFIPVPLVVDKGLSSSLLPKLDILLRGLWRLEESCLKEPGGPLHARLADSLSADGRRIFKQCNFESKYSMQRRYRRLDGFCDLSSGRYSVIEVNQAAPFGSHFNDVLQRMVQSLLDDMGFEYEPDLLCPRILDWLVGEYRERHGKDRLPRLVAAVIEHGISERFTDLPSVAAACEELSLERYGERIRFEVCYAPELKLRHGKAMLWEREADVIWRNSAYLTQCRQKGEDISDYEAIFSDPERHLIVNSTRSWLTRSKETFAVLWDDAACSAFGLSPEDRQAIRSFVPYTVNLGRNRDAAAEVLRDKDSWVGKPSDGDFGIGVEFGASHDAGSWRKLVEERSRDGYIFQKRVPYPSMEFPFIDETGAVQVTRLEFDLCPYHVDGSFPGTLISRANPPSTPGVVRKMNLSEGAIVLPVVVS
jgi:hypothetical protein